MYATSQVSWADRAERRLKDGGKEADVRDVKEIVVCARQHEIRKYVVYHRDHVKYL